MSFEVEPRYAGWTQQAEPGSAGAWYVYSGTTTPVTHDPIPAPPEGTQAVIADQESPSSNVLYQDVRLQAGAKHTLSLYVYYHSCAAMSSPNSLDFHTTDNQQFRVDVMKPTASAFSLAPSDILMNVFHTSTGDPESLAPTLITADLTPFAGQTVWLRIAQTDNQEILNAGVDDVRIASTPSVTAASPTGVTAVGATLSGTVDPGGLATTYHFEYGTTTAYGTSTSSQSAGADTATHNEVGGDQQTEAGDHVPLPDRRDQPPPEPRPAPT